MPARIQKLSADQEVKINYTELIELMYEQHHTRESVGMAIGKTGAAFGRYLSKSLPMPGEIVIKAAKALEIKPEEYGRYFYNAGTAAGKDKTIDLKRNELLMLKMLLIIGYTELPQTLWEEAQNLRRKIEDQLQKNDETLQSTAKSHGGLKNG